MAVDRHDVGGAVDEPEPRYEAHIGAVDEQPAGHRRNPAELGRRRRPYLQPGAKRQTFAADAVLVAAARPRHVHHRRPDSADRDLPTGTMSSVTGGAAARPRRSAAPARRNRPGSPAG